MNEQQIREALATVPGAIDITIKGRGARALMSLSIPDGPLPAGWRAITENAVYLVPGYRRVAWEGKR